MNKTKRTKIVSLGLTVLLLCGLFCVPVVAQGDNFLVNPQFELDENNDLFGWTLTQNHKDVVVKVTEQDIVKADTTFTGTGNTLNIVKNENEAANWVYIQTEGYMPLTKEREGHFSIYYKSTVDNAGRIYFYEYADERGTTSDASYEVKFKNLPSTNGKWTLYDVGYKAKYQNTQYIKIALRFQAASEAESLTANTSFAAPLFNWDIPEKYYINSNFESGYDDWSEYASDGGARDIFAEQNGNHYLKISQESNENSTYYRVFRNSETLTYGNIYKVSFKFLPTNNETPVIQISQAKTGIGEAKTWKNAKVVPLGTQENKKWCEYVCYVKMDGIRNKNGVDYEVDYMQLVLRANSGQTVGYDDVKVEDARGEFTFIQNNVEINELRAENLKMNYFNMEQQDVTCVFALYKNNGTAKTLADVSVMTSPALSISDTSTNVSLEITTSFENQISEIFSFEDGEDYEVKCFALSSLNGLVPVKSVAKAMTILMDTVQ